MGKRYVTDREFCQLDNAENNLLKGDYEACKFSGCNFAEVDLSEFAFEDCNFEDCDLSNIKTGNTAFRNVRFKDCKLLGVHFEECNPFLLAFQFENCHLNFSSFYQLKIKETRFSNCILQEVDFIETNLTRSLFENCDLSGSSFENSNLEKCNFSTSFNFIINPEINRIQHAKFSINNISGLLHQYNIEIE
ncbi:MAG: pentapeptide repeat-containing protein [Draconibacterium sp.]